MFADKSSIEEQAAVLALVSAAGSEWPWHKIAHAVTDAGSALNIIDGSWSGFEESAAKHLHDAAADRARQLVDESRAMIELEAQHGAHLVTVLDADYPKNLAEIYNRPPFLFIRGQVVPSDDRAIAVVGTRQASPEGLEQAARLSERLVKERVTIVSGMAAGVDTAAHRAAIGAGGRTLAVMGTGIRLRYPKENAGLADEIERHGALISQFWPDQPPAGFRFPMRNIVTSGLSLGTVVIEASKTSGARNQARHALEHGKRVFLVRSLVLREAWAQDYAENRGAIVIEDVDDILSQLVTITAAEQAEQLSFS